MAISDQEQEQNPCSIFDQLYCEEETLENDEEINESNNNNLIYFLPFYDDANNNNNNNEELKCLLNKEKGVIYLLKDVSLINARKEILNWMLKVKLYYGFSGLTLILSVNYFDRCIKLINHAKKNWTFQLLALACLSLAAKVEETHVPLLLDLQVEGASPIFDPKDIQKMELLVLSTLEWKMHPITPFTFVDHMIRRLGLNNNLQWEFLKKCEEVLLSLLFDWRFMSYLPSVLATSTMMHAIDQIESSNSLEYHTRLLDLLNLSKEKVNECYELIIETLSGSIETNNISKSKRRFEQMITNDWNVIIPTSPNGVMDTFYFSSDSSNDSWATTSNTAGGGRLSISCSVSSSPVVNVKRGKVHEQLMPLQLPSLSRVFAEVVESPR